MEQASYSICHHLFHYYPSQDTGAPGDGNEISVDFGEAEKQTNNQKKTKHQKYIGLKNDNRSAWVDLWSVNSPFSKIRPCGRQQTWLLQLFEAPVADQQI